MINSLVAVIAEYSQKALFENQEIELQAVANKIKVVTYLDSKLLTK
jgi:hypothetical protein